MEKKILGGYVKLLIKIGISGLCLWQVFRKIDLRELVQAFKTTHLNWLLVAFAFFVISKISSAIRLNTFFRAIGLNFSDKANLRLYWLGMFYNLFLPGGIGGDGYKIWWLNKQFDVSGKKLFWAVFFDRASGLMALGLLTCLLALMSPVFRNWEWAIILLGGIALATFYAVYHFFFPEFKPYFWSTNAQGILVQVAQLICVVCILKALNIHEHYVDYLMIFLVSSVVAIMPFTIGGLGARELVFLFGSQYLKLDMHYAVTISLWFYVITALVSLLGGYYVFNAKKLELKEG
ncbi:flippase-like domain-containing protein [Solitalea sp. MAHUQ-68]|uniref:Flippase-like domain-containing protein n=1 Tax=Solitalea agri TaxID=2953739 RepID=A0A9X2F655_9SPHI|nr:lysylphosphatidylglycerol synthase transmembrane domain-containing protein [Solitalea agri]MCO4292608.1 flippase-like domain-containing protein [Solitalea agri]